jgi:hypothetical protein
MNNRLATTTANLSGSDVRNNTYQRVNNHTSMGTNGQRPFITSTYPGNNNNSGTADGNNNISRTAAAPPCQLMACAKASSSSQDNNAY